MGWQVAAVEASLQSADVQPLPPITPVLCFIDGDRPLISPPDVFRGVRLEGPRSLWRTLAGEVLDHSEIARLARVLAGALPAK